MIKKHPKISKALLYVFISLIVVFLVMIAVLGGRDEKERYASADYSPYTVNLDFSNSNYQSGELVARSGSVSTIGWIVLSNIPYDSYTIVYSFVDVHLDTSLTFVYTNDDGQHISTLSNNGAFFVNFDNHSRNPEIPVRSRNGNVPVGYVFRFSIYCFPGDVTQSDYAMGYNQGYADGYNDKFGGTALTPQTMFLEPVHQWLNMELFPGFTLAGAFEVVLFVGLALIFIKMFAGG